MAEPIPTPARSNAAVPDLGGAPAPSLANGNQTAPQSGSPADDAETSALPAGKSARKLTRQDWWGCCLGVGYCRASMNYSSYIILY